jgi:hypothetical protein
MAKRGTKGLATPKRTKGGRKCGAGHAWRKKKVGGRKKWVCVKARKGGRRRKR